MKVKRSGFDRFYYLLTCVLTLGMWYGLRVLISEGIRQAIMDD